MGLRITTWNVNGIRNPFSYSPWREDRRFEAMFDILEADIVVMQETKIQRKDLRDDMVLVPGWDVYFSLPRHKKGYSGVAIYTRNAVCAPIRVEEGITGILCPPNSSTSFRDLPEEQQIGGYPSMEQLGETTLDFTELDSEGRCIIMEFPAFVLIGTYCPATRDESRHDFRIGFLNAVDARVRNLIAAGKSVFLTGDLNIVRDEMDTARLEEQLRKTETTMEEFFSTPARRLFNHLIIGGRVYGPKDEGRETPVMVDICREFHPTRQGMYTCWEQRINARPGNFGSRIDYVLCSEDMRDWFCESNIQEGLLGSDHCPVYAVLKEKVSFPGHEAYIKDLMNPDGMFKDGVRQREWTTKDLLPMSAKLIPEFDKRRSIRDMFTKKPVQKVESAVLKEELASNVFEAHQPHDDLLSPSKEDATLQHFADVIDSTPSQSQSSPTKPSLNANGKRPSVSAPVQRRVSQKTSANKGQPGKGQSSLMGFFKPKAASVSAVEQNQKDPVSVLADRKDNEQPVKHNGTETSNFGLDMPSSQSPRKTSLTDASPPKLDPLAAKESWTKLLSKKVIPRCEHNEPCISYVCKKKGMNLGRTFYICPRPIGPSGEKEKGTEWRCGTFVWASDAANFTST